MYLRAADLVDYDRLVRVLVLTQQRQGRFPLLNIHRTNLKCNTNISLFVDNDIIISIIEILNNQSSDISFRVM